jgi:hypothetical protein
VPELFLVERGGKALFVGNFCDVEEFGKNWQGYCFGGVS